MLSRPYKTYMTKIGALFATSATGLVLFAGIAAACEGSGGGGGGKCPTPTVSTGSATAITSTSATLNGTVNPQGCETYYYFEYGTSSSGPYPDAVAGQAGNGTLPKSVQTYSQLNLQPSTKYYFRLSAINSEGTKVDGSVVPFTTKSACTPIVTTGAPTSITDFNAVLNGTVDMHGCVGTYMFEWGPSSLPNAYPNVTPMTFAPTSSATVKAKISGLAASTGYHFRLSAVSAEAAVGADKPFVTAPAKQRDPILFVHGWMSDESTWVDMKGWFEKDWGWPSSRLRTFSYDDHQKNEITAQLVSAQVNDLLAKTGAQKVDIIAHSMGSLSSRYYIKFLGGTAKVEDWVSLAGPNHGTATILGCIYDGCEDMRFTSHFLVETLNAGDETPGTVRYATWRSSCDGAVVPADSVILSGAVKNVLTGCLVHTQIHRNYPVFEEVREFVE